MGNLLTKTCCTYDEKIIVKKVQFKNPCKSNIPTSPSYPPTPPPSPISYPPTSPPSPPSPISENNIYGTINSPRKIYDPVRIFEF